MYASTNLPGSQHFRVFGPASKSECQEWLDRREARLKDECGGLWFNAYSPGRIVSNKEARSWKWRDGTKIVT